MKFAKVFAVLSLLITVNSAFAGTPILECRYNTIEHTLGRNEPIIVIYGLNAGAKIPLTELRYKSYAERNASLDQCVEWSQNYDSLYYSLDTGNFLSQDSSSGDLERLETSASDLTSHLVPLLKTKPQVSKFSHTKEDRNKKPLVSFPRFE